jgi:hypothetical protein
MSQKVIIYALKDPRDGKIFYVGRSKNHKQRFSQHISEAKLYEQNNTNIIDRLFDEYALVTKQKGKNYLKIKRILDILNEGLEPKLIKLDEWIAPTIKEASKLEEAWIAEMRSKNQPICNYIYSTRMNPWWYSNANKYWKQGWATSPMEYIQRIKSESLNTQDVKTETKKMNRRQRAKLSRKLYRNKK